MNGLEWIATVAIGLAILVGIAGTFLPILPGLFLVWLAVIAYGVLVGFDGVGWMATAATTALLGLGFFLSLRIPQKHASRSGLGTAAQLFGLGMALAGFFVIPVIGFPIGFVLGVFLVRFRTSRDAGQAWASTRHAIASVIRASAAQAACGVGMFVVWLGWVAWVALG